MFETVSFIVILVIVPGLLGYLVCHGMEGILYDSYIYRFIAGFMTELAIWAIMATPYMIFFEGKPFHYLRYIYIAIIATLCVISVHQIIKHKLKLSELISNIQTGVLELAGSGYQRIYIVVFLIIVLLQIFETIYYAPVGYVNDDLNYFPEILDSTYLDTLRFNGFKRLLAPWYAFLAFISATSHIHTLILCRTLMPVYLIILVHLSGYVFGRFFFNKNMETIRIYLMWTAVMLTALSYTYYLFYLTSFITVYGKIVAGIIGVPFLFLSAGYMMSGRIEGEKTLVRNAILLFILGTGTSMLSFAGLLVCPTGLLFLMTVFSIKYRDKSKILCMISAEIPFLIEVFLYIYIKCK